MNRMDLLIKEVDHFVKASDLKKYFKENMMDIALEKDTLHVIYQNKEYRFELMQDQEEVYWYLDQKQKIAYNKENGIECLLEMIIKGSL